MSHFQTRLAAMQPDEPVRGIVRYKDVEAKRSSRALAGVMTGHDFQLIPAAAVAGSAKDIAALAGNPEIAEIWEDLPVHTMLDVSVPLVRAPQLWNQDFEGQGIRIAVVDTGIDPDHPDFEGRIVAIEDFTGGDSGGRDGNGHGTHVASTIAGSGAASGGKYIGVAPEAELLAAKVLRDNGSGMTSDVMAGVEWAVAQGAHVINLSLGADTSCDGTDGMSAICDAAVDAGAVVCVAAGNAGPGAGTVGSPGCAFKVITVGATTDQDAVTSFSSRGPTADGRVKPDVCFPGYNIVAARARGTSMGTPVDAFYTSASGTSMATPHASGASALLLQAHPGSTPADIKSRLMATAVDIGADANSQGSGRADILAAHQYSGELPLPTPTPGPTPEPPPAEPGGCLTLGSARSRDDSVAGGVPKEVWWIVGALILLCLCVVCAAGTLIAIGLAG